MGRNSIIFMCRINLMGQKRHPQSVIILEERIWQRRMVFRSVIIMEEVKLFYPCREM